MNDDDKEWMRVSRAANGATSVTCTLQRGSLTVRWSVKTFTDITPGVAEARAGAQTALTALEAALEQAS